MLITILQDLDIIFLQAQQNGVRYFYDSLTIDVDLAGGEALVGHFVVVERVHADAAAVEDAPQLGLQEGHHAVL